MKLFAWSAAIGVIGFAVGYYIGWRRALRMLSADLVLVPR